MSHVREVARKSGRAYEVRWRDGGRERQRTFTVKREAEQFAARVDVAVQDGTTTAGMVRQVKTVAEVVEASLAASAPRLKPRTVDGYRRSYDLRVLPRFGTTRISAVTSEAVERWVADMVGEGLAPATVHHQYVALAKAMKYAARHRLITHNPCVGVELPRVANRDDFAPVFLTMADVERVAAALDDRAPYGTLVRFAAYSGLRAAEITGLRVRDVNLAAGHVEVRQTLQRMRGRLVYGTPKSAHSTRNVPLVDRGLIAELRRLMMTHPKSGEPDALFWPGRGLGSHALDYDGVLDVGSFRRNYFRPALRELGLPEMRFHDLRHTAASLWLAAGFSTWQVSRRLGHANTNTTDAIYAHLYPSDYSDDVARFEALRASPGLHG